MSAATKPKSTHPWNKEAAAKRKIKAAKKLVELVIVDKGPDHSQWARDRLAVAIVKSAFPSKDTPASKFDEAHWAALRTEADKFVWLLCRKKADEIR
jgi:hypothetical protein